MVIKILKYIILALVVAFCQTILSNLTSILGIAPNFGTILIFLIVLRTDFETALPAAFLVGLVIDALNPENLGLGTATRFAIAAAVHEIKQHLDIDRIQTRLYLLIGSEFCFQSIYQLAVNSFDFGSVPRIYLEVSLPTLAYTVVVGMAIMLLTDLDYKLEIRRRSLG